MKKGLVVILLVLPIVIVLLLLLPPVASKKSPAGTASNRATAVGHPVNSLAYPTNFATTDSSGRATFSSPAAFTNVAANAGVVEPAAATPPPDIPPAIVVENVRHAVTQFGAEFGGNPVGTNPEITSQLSGNNPKQINFIKPEAGMRINENGELVDPWGTPLFFHQLSGTDTEIRSAGPDKILWNLDDLVAR